MHVPASVEVITGSLADESALRKLCAGTDVVLHLAGAIKAANQRAFFEVNEKGTRNLVLAAGATGVRRFIHVSSLAARKPEISPYAASKCAAEVAVQGARGLEACIIRPAAVYGPGDVATLPLLKSLMGTIAVLPGLSDSRFSLIHVDDLASILADAVTQARQGVLEVDDLSGGYGWRDLIDVTRSQFSKPDRCFHLPRSVAMFVGHGADVWAGLTGQPQMISAGKFREMYEPDWVVTGANWPRTNPIPLSAGLPGTIRWYQAQGLLPRTGTADTRRGQSGPSSP